MRLGLVLLPDEASSASCVRFAEMIVGDRTPRVVVGPEALPHITLLHIESDEDPAMLWREAKDAIAPAFSLDVLALGLLRYDTPYNAPAADPATMAWLIIPCSRALREAEQIALGLPMVSRSRVTTGNGDLFQPHVTLAIWDGETPPYSAVLPFEVFGGKRMPARLALGEIGPNGTYRRTLFSVS